MCLLALIIGSLLGPTVNAATCDRVITFQSSALDTGGTDSGDIAILDAALFTYFTVGVDTGVNGFCAIRWGVAQPDGTTDTYDSGDGKCNAGFTIDDYTATFDTNAGERIIQVDYYTQNPTAGA